MSLTSRLFRSPSGGQDPEDVTLDLPMGDVFDMLKNERRRWTLRAVADSEEGATDLRTLSRQLTAYELGEPESTIRSDDKKARYVGLYQNHLPRLDELGLVGFESDRGVVYATPRTSHAVAFLDVCAAMAEGRE